MTEAARNTLIKIFRAQKARRPLFSRMSGGRVYHPEGCDDINVLDELGYINPPMGKLTCTPAGIEYLLNTAEIVTVRK